MALQAGNLKRIANGGVAANGTSPGVYSLVTTDDWATVNAAGYFNSVADVLEKGDVIICALDVDATPQARMLVVTDVSGGAVTVAQVTNA